MATVYCRKCGNEVRGKFCTTCGTPIQDSAAQQPEAPDSGATTIIRAEDIQRMAAQEAASPVPPTDTGPAASTPPWSQQDPTASQGSPWPQQQDAASPGWTQPNAGQSGQSQWDQLPGGQSNQQWQQPPPEPQWGQAPGAGAGQQNYGSPPPQSGSYYSAPGGVNMQGGGGGTVAASTDIGTLVSSALTVLTSRMQDILPLVAVYAVIYTVGQMISIPGHGLQIIGILVGLVGYAFIEAAMVYVTQAAVNGGTATFNDILTRVGAVLPRLLGAVIVAYIAIILGLIGIIIGALVVFTFLVFVPQAVVLDNAGVFNSLEQSWKLVATDFFGTLGRVIIAILILIVPAIVVGIVSVIVGHVPIVGLLVSGFLGGLLISYFMAYSTLMFFGTKARRDAVSVGAASQSFTGY